ncbi:hypothetical protein [Nemorincola caseinilytica]
MILVLAPVVLALLFSSCSDKVYTASTATTAGPNAADYLPFTKSLKFRLDNDKADLRKLQFYTDRPITLRHTGVAGNGVIMSGTVSYDKLQDVTEVTIPAYTPGICERVKGDSLFISFDAPQNVFVFAALYANENFMMQGTNWYNGVADVTYDGKTYRASCDECGSLGEVRLMIKKSQSGGYKTPAGGGKVIAGRKLN